MLDYHAGVPTLSGTLRSLLAAYFVLSGREEYMSRAVGNAQVGLPFFRSPVVEPLHLCQVYIMISNEHGLHILTAQNEQIFSPFAS